MRVFKAPQPVGPRMPVVLICGAVLFFALLGAAPATTQAAFGISPPFLNADHLTPGVTYQQTVYLVQDQPDVDLPIHAALTVPDAIKPWFSIDQGFDFTIPSGTRQFPVVVSIKVPQDASLGKYSGTLVFTTQPSTGGQVAISLGANVDINLTVGNDIFENYKVTLVTLPDIEEGWNPRAAVRFENDGNVPESFDAATFDLYDHFDAVRLAYITKQSGFPEIPAFATKEFTIEFPTDFHLGVGDYWGSVNFYKDNQVVASQKTIFHVLPAGSLAPFGSFGALTGKYWPYIVSVLVIIAILVVWRVVAASRRRRRHA